MNEKGWIGPSDPDRGMAPLSLILHTAAVVFSRACGEMRRPVSAVRRERRCDPGGVSPEKETRRSRDFGRRSASSWSRRKPDGVQKPRDRAIARTDPGKDRADEDIGN